MPMSSFKSIGLSVLVKVFKVLTIYGCGGHLGKLLYSRNFPYVVFAIFRT